jgi:hypothetical protein
MKDEEPLKDECKRIRLQIILGINQLRSILGTLKEEPTDDLRKSLAEWVKYMNKLHRQSISLLKPSYRPGMGKGALEIARIMKYQGINEKQLQEAIDEM